MRGVYQVHKVYGLFVDESTVHLHGEATAVHSNRNDGIHAQSRAAKVTIHLPSHHNTCHNNGKEDRSSSGGLPMSTLIMQIPQNVLLAVVAI